MENLRKAKEHARMLLNEKRNSPNKKVKEESEEEFLKRQLKKMQRPPKKYE